MKIGGFLLCMAGVITLCGMDAVVKAMGPHLGTFQIAFIRYGGAALWLVPYILLTRSPWPNLGNWRRHLQRGAMMVVTACLFFYAVTHLQLAIVAALAMTAPLYVSLLGMIFLRERPSPLLGVAILLAMAGSAVIIVGADFTGATDMSGWIAGVLAPLAYAVAIVLLKRHAGDEGAGALTFSSAVVAATILLPLAAPSFVVPPADVWPLMVLTGFLGAAGFILLTTGLQSTPASTFAIVDYSSLLWAAGYGFLFFGEVPEPRFWIGGGLIVAACALGIKASARTMTPATA